jgi:hypothetical protein
LECRLKKLTLFEDVIWLQNNLKIISQLNFFEKDSFEFERENKILKGSMSNSRLIR